MLKCEAQLVKCQQLAESTTAWAEPDLVFLDWRIVATRRHAVFQKLSLLSITLCYGTESLDWVSHLPPLNVSEPGEWHWKIYSTSSPLHSGLTPAPALAKRSEVVRKLTDHSANMLVLMEKRDGLYGIATWLAYHPEWVVDLDNLST
jgi:hypothetical protein